MHPNSGLCILTRVTSSHLIQDCLGAGKNPKNLFHFGTVYSPNLGCAPNTVTSPNFGSLYANEDYKIWVCSLRLLPSESTNFIKKIRPLTTAAAVQTITESLQNKSTVLSSTAATEFFL